MGAQFIPNSVVSPTEKNVQGLITNDSRVGIGVRLAVGFPFENA